MNSLFSKILVILLIILGEALMIYAEMLGAKTYTVSSNPFLKVFLKMFLIMVLAGGLLIAGYMLGFSSFKSIWVVSIASITAILVIEPVLAFAFFKQMPTKGAIIGFVLGVLGFIAAVFF
jgi:hypothetical protein